MPAISFCFFDRLINYRQAYKDLWLVLSSNYKTQQGRKKMQSKGQIVKISIAL